MKKDKGITIGYDAKRAVANSTGLGNYSRLVIGTMGAMYPANNYVLFTPRRGDNERFERLLMRENVKVVTPSTAAGRRFPAMWRSAGIAADVRNEGIDLYHGLSNEIPLVDLPCPTVVTIHDLIWRRVPGDYSAIDRRLYDFKYGRSARRATRIIAISEKTKADLIEDWHIDPQRIDVVYQGCDPIFSRAVTVDDRERVKKAYNLPERYILAVGTVQSRKNQLLAVRALKGLDPEVKLVIVGRGDRTYGPQVKKEIERLSLGDRVLWLENVPFDDLPALYRSAVFSSYTSRYEGFGLPVAESLLAGTPVVACTGSCLEEAGGKGGIYVAPDDVDGYIEAARSIITQPWLRDRLAENGARHVKRFTAAAFAEGIMKTYNKAILDFVMKDL